jgi:hypothetical protein
MKPDEEFLESDLGDTDVIPGLVEHALFELQREGFILLPQSTTSLTSLGNDNVEWRDTGTRVWPAFAADLSETSLSGDAPLDSRIHTNNSVAALSAISLASIVDSLKAVDAPLESSATPTPSANQVDARATARRHPRKTQEEQHSHRKERMARLTNETHRLMHELQVARAQLSQLLNLAALQVLASEHL